ncbi:MAG TPA: ethylbenzene dehydrogenase-related protein [Geminicoccaceae bacterium]
MPLLLAGLAGGPALAEAPQVLEAPVWSGTIVVDGDVGDWARIEPLTVPLSGTGGAAEVQLKAVVRDGRIYMMATWADGTRGDQHKPYRWDAATYSYKKTEDMEDRLALSLRISGEFSANKLSGAEFTADVWHWKAHRSNPVGLAHDKVWRVSRTPFEKSRAFRTSEGATVHLLRSSDAGDQLYKSVRYYMPEADLMPSYELNPNAAGSISDVQASGVWRDGRWYLELSRALDTGHDDDAPVPRSGDLEFAVAVFDGIAMNSVDGGDHSYSGRLILRTSGEESS